MATVCKIIRLLSIKTDAAADPVSLLIETVGKNKLHLINYIRAAVRSVLMAFVTVANWSVVPSALWKCGDVC